ncbi:hypothetical protein DICPUDRAFT_74322 [Dictyostelium purpureum]|uniref:S-formylglutathione hydrolase n=1 Tax=Dictyostelium purpureum TaxID=5786 RepID=F0Z7E2_DICPU|nr:uncharacterized protein DICPUDRAFT_74322 [Dictyostelium purpureum]EGC40125.1 hypothetical protein DICPUDRAFT_74322 [Dictyostelium purpureum]|eukprot:XP_003283315.1 hypothetical protein DICPUDRAFT_74322 [Dictyostelium purpureum]
MSIKLLSTSKCFGGEIRRYSHQSDTLSCEMKFHVYVPPKSDKKPSILYFLGGLTCTDENFIQKGGAPQYAANCNIFLVCPDSSPRGVPAGEEDCWSGPGAGAGYYLNASNEKYKKHYNMYDYITKELYTLISTEFKDLTNTEKQSIFGHSMGGMGALNIFFKNSNLYKSISAFSPISNPINCEWASKALKSYLGDDQSKLEEYDPTFVLKSYSGPKVDLLVDIGTADEFFNDLKVDKLKEVNNQNINLTLRHQDGYNHGYFYVSTFMKDHIEFHSKYLN